MEMGDIRRFMGLMDDEQDALANVCIEAAKQWYAHAGVPDREGDGLYDFWVTNLATWFFDNRGATGDDSAIPPSIVTSVHQLRKKRPDPEAVIE